jgi:DNA-binding winged helix-turn-helix (wHTH) protein
LHDATTLSLEQVLIFSDFFGDGGIGMYAFGQFRLDPQQRLLFAEGVATPLDIAPRVLETLLYLVEHAGELLSKDQLLAAIWPGTVVEENSLNQNISQLRRLLGERPGDHRFILTASGRGYRFVAPVRRVAATTAVLRPQEAAESLYKEALPLALRPSEENLRGALELLQQCQSRDPTFAPAFSLRAVVEATCLIFDYPMARDVGSAEKCARRALLLDPRDARAHGAIGIVSALRGQWLAAETGFKTSDALSSDPFMQALCCVHLLQSVGHVRKALDLALRAHAAAPSQPIGAQMVALVAVLCGDNATAQRYTDISINLGQPRHIAPATDIQGQLQLRAGKYAEAAESIARGLTLQQQAEGGANAARLMCQALADARHVPAARSAVQAFQVRLGESAHDQAMLKRLLLWHTMLGDLDESHALAARALDHFASKGTVGSAWGALWLPEMAPLRSDSRFAQFAVRLGLPEYWKERGGPEI